MNTLLEHKLSVAVELESVSGRVGAADAVFEADALPAPAFDAASVGEDGRVRAVRIVAVTAHVGLPFAVSIEYVAPVEFACFGFRPGGFGIAGILYEAGHAVPCRFPFGVGGISAADDIAAGGLEINVKNAGIGVCVCVNEGCRKSGEDFA